MSKRIKFSSAREILQLEGQPFIEFQDLDGDQNYAHLAPYDAEDVSQTILEEIQHIEDSIIDFAVEQRFQGENFFMNRYVLTRKHAFGDTFKIIVKFTIEPELLQAIREVDPYVPSQIVFQIFGTSNEAKQYITSRLKELLEGLDWIVYDENLPGQKLLSRTPATAT